MVLHERGGRTEQRAGTGVVVEQPAHVHAGRTRRGALARSGELVHRAGHVRPLRDGHRSRVGAAAPVRRLRAHVEVERGALGQQIVRQERLTVGLAVHLEALNVHIGR